MWDSCVQFLVRHSPWYSFCALVCIFQITLLISSHWRVWTPTLRGRIHRIVFQSHPDWRTEIRKWCNKRVWLPHRFINWSSSDSSRKKNATIHIRSLTFYRSCHWGAGWWEETLLCETNWLNLTWFPSRIALGIVLFSYWLFSERSSRTKKYVDGRVRPVAAL
jgi:hypothetical protein